MKVRYTFPCILTYENDSISAAFPDLKECYAVGSDEEEIFYNAKESLGLHLYALEIKGGPIPSPASLQDLKTNKNEVITFIEVFMPLFRKHEKETIVKKTLTIPEWLNKAALKEDINFSKVLQEALKQKLGIERK